MNLLSLVGPRLDNICQIRRKWYYSSGWKKLQSKHGPSLGQNYNPLSLSFSFFFERIVHVVSTCLHFHAVPTFSHSKLQLTWFHPTSNGVPSASRLQQWPGPWTLKVKEPLQLHEDMSTSKEIQAYSTEHCTEDVRANAKPRCTTSSSSRRIGQRKSLSPARTTCSVLYPGQDPQLGAVCNGGDSEHGNAIPWDIRSQPCEGHARRQVHGSHASHQKQVAKATSASVRVCYSFF